jgi:hypothetical protein
MYLPDTNSLLTRFLAETSLVELIDFMTISEEGEPQRLVRMRTRFAAPSSSIGSAGPH